MLHQAFHFLFCWIFEWTTLFEMLSQHCRLAVTSSVISSQYFVLESTRHGRLSLFEQIIFGESSYCWLHYVYQPPTNPPQPNNCDNNNDTKAKNNCHWFSFIFTFHFIICDRPSPLVMGIRGRTHLLQCTVLQVVLATCSHSRGLKLSQLGQQTFHYIEISWAEFILLLWKMMAQQQD